MTKLISVKNLTKTYTVKESYGFRKKSINAVDHINLEIERGQSLGLIGESGCGKSTLAKLILGLENPTEGEVYFDGTQISTLSNEQLRCLREHMQMIFQNSASVFDPGFTIGNSMIETLKNFQKGDIGECRRLSEEMLQKAGLDASFMGRYPSELSGGERQRANIARALLLHPCFVVCDEPVSSLDYSLRKRMLDLLNQLKQEFDLTYLFITHDLSTVNYVCDSVAIMYLGKIVEWIGDIQDLENKICHPYSQALFEAVPRLEVGKKRNRVRSLKGDILTQHSQTGCRFKERCPYRKTQCEEEPLLTEYEPGHFVACHRIKKEY